VLAAPGADTGEAEGVRAVEEAKARILLLGNLFQADSAFQLILQILQAYLGTVEAATNVLLILVHVGGVQGVAQTAGTLQPVNVPTIDTVATLAECGKHAQLRREIKTPHFLSSLTSGDLAASSLLIDAI